MHKHARASLVAAGAVLALGAAQLPWLAPRLALAGGGAWLLARGLRLAPAPAIFCAAGYLGSAALLGLGPRGDLDSYATLAEIGLAAALFALLAAWRRGADSASGPRWAGALGVLLAFAGFCGAVHVAGFAGENARWSCSFVAGPVLACAFAGVASATGELAGRTLVQALAVPAAFFALRLPERCAWLAPVGALGLALVAADALGSAPRAARALGGAACALLAALSLSGNAPAPVAAAHTPLDGQDEWVRWRKLAARPGALAWEVDVDARVPVAAVQLALVSETDGRRLERPMQREARPGGARFTHAPVPLAALRDPSWSVELELLGPSGARTGLRVIDRLVLRPAPARSPALLGFLAAALLLLALRGRSGLVALSAAGLAIAQALWLYAPT